jgi:Domain of unknown function (DUF4287)
MSFEAYLRNIEARTGKSPEELRAVAIEAGVFTPTMKASELVALLEQEFSLGHRHSMAVWAASRTAGGSMRPRRK